MRPFVIYYLVLLTWSIPAPAQGNSKTVLWGKVIDAAGKEAVAGATVRLVSLVDSTVYMGLTDKAGGFGFASLSRGACYEAFITATGFEPAKKKICMQDSTVDGLDTVQLHRLYNEMEAVVVKAVRPLMQFNHDTVFFDAGRFSLMDNSMAEQLLRQIPGFQFDDQGNLLYLGEPVGKITVDGKELFGGDGKLILKNLSADLVRKIQVHDYKDFSQRFLGTLGQSKLKVVNLVLNPAKPDHYFGEAYLGGGTTSRYESGVYFNVLKPAYQLALAFGSNNIAPGGFGTGRFEAERLSTSMPAANGLYKSSAGSISLSTLLGKKVNFTGTMSYLYDGRESIVNSRKAFESADSSWVNRFTQQGGDRRKEYNAILRLDYALDSMTAVFVAGSVVRRSNNSMHFTLGDIYSNQQRTNASNAMYEEKGQGLSAMVEAGLGRKLNRCGRGVTLGYIRRSTTGEATYYNRAQQLYYPALDSVISDSIYQKGTHNEDDGQDELTFTWTEPVSRQACFLFRYNYQLSRHVFDKGVWEFNPPVGQFNLPDSLLTGQARYKIANNAPNVWFSYTGKDFTLLAGGVAQWIENRLVTGSSKYDFIQKNRVLLPSLTATLNAKRNHALFLNYTTAADQPSLQQVWPIPDNSNSISVWAGNPGLKPSYTHNLGASVIKSYENSFWQVRLAYWCRKNEIVNELSFDSVQVVRPANVKGTTGITAAVNYSCLFKWSETSVRLSLSADLSYRRSIAIVNHTYYPTKTWGALPELSLDLKVKQLLQIRSAVKMILNTVKSVSAAGQSIGHYSGFVVRSSVVWMPVKRIQLSGSCFYQQNKDFQLPGGRNRPFLHAGVQYQLLPQKPLYVVLKAVNWLNNGGLPTRNISIFLIEETEVNNSGRFYMLNLIWSWRK